METEKISIATRLIAFQTKLSNPPKNRAVTVTHKSGGKHTFAYATLDAILDQIRVPLAEAGLALVQRCACAVGPDGKITQTLRTELRCDVQEIVSELVLPTMVNMQELGSCITYLRRYALCSLIGVAAEDDTDGPQFDSVDAEKVDAERAERLAKMARAGKLTSANTGKPLTEEDVKPTAEPPPVDQAEQKTEPASVPDEPGDQLPFDTELPPRLMALLRRDGVTTEQFRLYLIKRGLYPDTIQLSKIPDAKIETYITNWKTISERIRGAK